MLVKSYDTKIGKITIGENEGYIINIYFGKEALPKEAIEEETDLIKETIKQINLYLDGKLEYVNVPIKLQGTNFQKLVWNELMKVPYGKTCTYRDIAKNIGNEKACRAVGNANNKNRLPIIVPCHRIIGTNGKLVGYAGGLDIKEKLLDVEKRNIKNN